MKSPTTRITIDIDSHVPNPRMRAIKAYHGLQNAGAYDVTVATSSSGEGYHLVGHFESRVPLDEQFDIRRNLNDDPNRIKMDEQRAARGLPINTMWTEKAGNEGTRTEFTTIWDAIDYVDQNARTDAERVHGLANNGHRAVKDAEIPHLKQSTGV